MTDEFLREAYAREWTPPHGTDKRRLRGLARSRLKRKLRAIVDAIFAPDNHVEEAWGERRQKRGDE